MKGGRYNKPPGGPGGGGGGGGGGGDDDDDEDEDNSRSSDHGFTAPRRPQHFDLNSNQGGAGLRLLTRDRSPFDCKDKGDLPKFNGRDQREFWRKKVSYFLCGKCPDLRPVFTWAEKQIVAVISASLAAAHSDEFPEVRNDPNVLSFHLHGFLDTNLTDDAWNIFDNVGTDQNGLEVRRLVNLETAQKTQAERLTLENAALNPKKIRSLHDVAKGFVEWDMARKAYVDAGGKSLDDERKCGAIMRMLPD